MGRTHNKDYYTAEGTDLTSVGVNTANRRMYTQQLAQFRREAPRPRRRPSARTAQAAPLPGAAKAPAPAKAKAKAKTEPRERKAPAEKKERTAAKAAPPSETRKRRTARDQEAMRVEPLQRDKPKHGQKRRAAKKRHDVEVLQGTAERRPAAAPARPSQPKARLSPERMPTAAPPAVREAARSFVDRWEKRGRRAWEVASDLVNAPRDLVRMLRDWRTHD